MLASRVFPGAALVRATRWRTSALMRLDLPTLERPTRAISASPSRGRSLALAALRMKLASMFKEIVDCGVLIVDSIADSISNQSSICNQQSTISLMRDGIVDGVNGRGLRLGGQTARQRLGQRDFQDLVH